MHPPLSPRVKPLNYRLVTFERCPPGLCRRRYRHLMEHFPSLRRCCHLLEHCPSFLCLRLSLSAHHWTLSSVTLCFLRYCWILENLDRCFPESDVLKLHRVLDPSTKDVTPKEEATALLQQATQRLSQRGLITIQTTQSLNIWYRWTCI